MERRLQASGNSPTLLDIEEGRVDIVERPSAGEQCCHYFRVFVQFLFSYIGLTAMLCGYLFLGALVFRSIEGPKEMKLREDIHEEMKQTFLELYSEAERFPAKNWTDLAIDRMKEKQRHYAVHSIVFLEYLDDTEKWSFFGAMLFSLTVLSTIGYGHIAPLTWYGQLFCMLYALVGIPLMLLVLTNVGRVMATSARLLYRMYTSRLCKRVRCGKRGKSKKKKRKKQAKNALQRKGSTRSTKGTQNKKKARKGSKKSSKKGAQKPRQTVVNMDNQTKVTNTRPLSLNMELVSAADSRLPPPYDESNEMAERLLEDREDAGDAQGSRLSISSSSQQQSLVNLPRPISEEIGEGSADDIRSVVSLATSSEASHRSPSLPKSESYDSAGPQPFASASRAGSNIELGGTRQNKSSSFPRQQSCIEFRQFDKGDEVGERKDGDGSEGDSSRSSSEPKSISRQGSSASRHSPSGASTYPRTNVELRAKRRGEHGGATIDRTSLGLNHKYSNTFPRRRFRGRKKVLMRPPTLKSLHHHRKLKLIDSTLAIRLATYDKMLGSSREDLAFALPELSCGENTKLLNDIAMKGFDPRPPPPPPESELSRDRLRKSKGKRRKKKGRRSETGDDELGTIYEGSESDTSEGRARGDIEVSEIPMWPVLLLLFGYITSGAILFDLIEANWNIFDAFYFCFITLTTIGFGDLVPDNSLISLIACCIYTMIGMAVTSMCIALIMKKFVVTVKNFGRKIGIIKDD
ncbi:uncharacterized protein [Diadema setosum]|uniref:uncharacterized protein n=1 Tax=Diadema setosum TaxID=31175 RepID=UPI003B3B5A24